MKTTAFALCILACSLLPALHCRAEDKQPLSLEFVSCDTDGNVHVKLANNTDKPLRIETTLSDGPDLSGYLRIISIEPSEDNLPYLWKKHPSMGSHFGNAKTIDPRASMDCKVNIYGVDWLFGKRTMKSSPLPEKFPSGAMNGIAKKLFVGDEVVIIYQGNFWSPSEQGDWNPNVVRQSGTLLCYGKVSSKPKSN